MLTHTENIDYLFVRSFCEEDIAFNSDLPLMLQDFLFHENEKILEYSGAAYADDDFQNSGATKGLRYKFLNLLLSAARHGSGYSAEMLCRIYKIYYRKEYNQLKRFKTLSFRELRGFDNDEELFATIAARILTIAPFMGIEVDSECMWAEEEIEEILEDTSMGFKFEPKWITFNEEFLKQRRAEAEELLARFKKKNPDYFFDNRVQKFMWKVFEYNGVPSDFDLLCEEEFGTDAREYMITIGLLKLVWPRKAFSDEEIEFFHAIYRLLTIFIEHLGVLDDNIDYMLGRYDRFKYELEDSKYRPVDKKTTVVARSVAGQTKQEKERESIEDRNSLQKATRENEELYTELQSLREAQRAKDQTIARLNRMYQEAVEREKQNRLDQESAENDREELAKLREYLYHLTEGDLEAVSVSEEEMEKDISGRKIVIVGGHDNWIGFLKEKFPDWGYIKPGVSNTVPESAVMYAEHLFFFTDTISHGVYNKFLKVVRTHRIPFDYLHGTNIPMTIKQIYDAVRNK